MPRRHPLAAASPPVRTPSAMRSLPLRSAVTNGTKLFLDGDDKSPWARRFRDLVELHLDDLGPRDGLSEAQCSLVRRAAALEVSLEQMEAAMSTGGAVNLDLYQRMSNTLRRLLSTLGIERAKHDVTLTLEDIQREYAARDRAS